MPKKIKQLNHQISICSNSQSTCKTQANQYQNKKRHLIKKHKQTLPTQSQKLNEQCMQAFFQLMSVINEQFSAMAGQFHKKTSVKNLTPLGSSRTQKKGLQISILPTINEMSRMAEEQEDSSKKQKEQTQIDHHVDLSAQKVW